MKIRATLFYALFLSIQLFAQGTYPEVTIKDVNFIPSDSLIFYGTTYNDEPEPDLAGDTVMITGVVMNSPYFNANIEDGEMLSAGAPALYLQDTDNPEWGGVLCRDPYLNSEVFAILDSGMIIQALFEVEEYFTTTEINLVSFDASNVIGQMQRPAPVLLTLDSLFESGTTTPNYLAEKWEGVYVELQNLTTYDRNAVGSGTFRVIDENGTSLLVYNKGMFIRNGYVAPSDGTNVTRIRGFIETRTGSNYGWFMLNPVYPEDIVYGESAPNISEVERDKGVVGFNEAVTITARVVDEDLTAGIKSVKLNYKVNEAEFTSVDMTLTDNIDSVWSAQIPAVTDSSLIRYYVSAVDSNDFTSSSPSNPDNSYFYMVLNRPLTIKDIQYSPFGSGYSGYNNYEVTVSGIVTADTTDLQGDGANVGPQVYLQDASAPWSGIQIFGVDADASLRGDELTVTGIVNDNFGATRIGTLDNGVQVMLNGTGAELPEPVIISTADIGTSLGGALPAESYEGVIIKIENVTVMSDNADGESGPDGSNYGEILIADTSGVQMRLELQDGTHDYHNYWDASLENSGIRIETGHKFESITGVLFYSFSNYKLVPRKNDDFVGHVTDVKVEESIPVNYGLSQNYPNPFNPTTVIEYNIPAVKLNRSEGQKVVLRIFDILGREVKTLVNKVQQPGAYEVSFDASQLSSGIYFYSLNAGEFYQTKKMLLMK